MYLFIIYKTKKVIEENKYKLFKNEKKNFFIFVVDFIKQFYKYVVGHGVSLPSPSSVKNL